MVVRQDLGDAFGSKFRYINSGRMINQGIELSVNAVALRKGNFEWALGATLSRNKAEIKALGGSNESVITLTDGGQIITRVGESPYAFYGLQAEGVFSTTAEAEAADLFHAVVLSRSQRTGDKGTAADAEQISECHKDHKHRCRHGNRVHLIGIVGLSHENRVHHVVQHGDQHAQDRGDRQRCHCPGDRVNFKNREFLFFYLHIWTSFLEYIFGNTAQRLCDRCVVKFFVR